MSAAEAMPLSKISALMLSRVTTTGTNSWEGVLKSVVSASGVSPFSNLTATFAAAAATISEGFEIVLYWRSEEHTSELQSLMRISYAVFCLKKKQKSTKSIYKVTYNCTTNYHICQMRIATAAHVLTTS